MLSIRRSATNRDALSTATKNEESKQGLHHQCAQLILILFVSAYNLFTYNFHTIGALSILDYAISNFKVLKRLSKDLDVIEVFGVFSH
jgi:hypothetical protein